MLKKIKTEFALFNTLADEICVESQLSMVLGCLVGATIGLFAFDGGFLGFVFSFFFGLLLSPFFVTFYFYLEYKYKNRVDK